MQNIFARVPLRKPEIQDAFAGIEHAGASMACAETVDQPGELFVWSKFKNFYAADAAQGPWRGDFWTRCGLRSGFASKAADVGSFGGIRHGLSIIASVFGMRTARYWLFGAGKDRGTLEFWLIEEK